MKPHYEYKQNRIHKSVYRYHAEKEEHGNLVKDSKEWRKTKVLGTHLSTNTDIQQSTNKGYLTISDIKYRKKSTFISHRETSLALVRPFSS